MKTIVRIGIVGVFCAAVAAVSLFAGAQGAPGIEYPVSELGNCGSQAECKVFCDAPENHDFCIAFAESRGFIRSEEAERMRTATQTDIMEKGPGGCVTPEECDAFCRVEENLRECVNYGVEKGFVTQAEADEIFAKAERGGPGGCTSELECRAFCQNPTNARECLQFAANEGKISQEEADFLAERAGTRQRPREPEEDIDVEKARAVLAERAGPGGCSTTDECKEFCEDTAHMDECTSFAVEHGLMPAEQIERMRKMMSGGPGGCQGPEACDAYCSTPEHGEECMQFTIDNGLMAPEEIEQMKKEREIVQKLNQGQMAGPGGCNSKETCSAYCADEAHIEECVQFAGQTGMMTPERVQTMMGRTEGARREMQIREEERREVREGTMGIEGMFGPSEGEGMMPGFEGMPPQEFREMMPLQEIREGMPEGMMPPGDMMREIQQQIQQFAPPEGMMPPEGGMMYGPPPGGDMGPPPGGETAPPPSDYQGGSILETLRGTFIDPFAKILGL